MIKEFVDAWERNKHKLKEFFETTKYFEFDTYGDIVKLIFDICLDDIENGFNTAQLITLDHGSYQGTKIFIVPKQTYQPSIEDYVYTHNYYGSCSGCDTLQHILYSLATCDDSDSDFCNADQVEELMILALHLLQKMKYLGGDQ